MGPESPKIQRVPIDTEAGEPRRKVLGLVQRPRKPATDDAGYLERRHLKAVEGERESFGGHTVANTQDAAGLAAP